jgi:hypothetical protein
MKPDFDIQEFVQVLDPEDEQLFLEAARDRAGSFFGFKTLEELVCSEDGFGLDADGTVTNTQRAILRILEGRPPGKLADSEIVRDALGYGELPDFTEPPAEVVILAAVRSGKSLFAAARAIWASQTIDLGPCRRSRDIPRFSILSLERDNAVVTFSHLLGALQQPRLSHLKVSRKSLSKWREIIDESGADIIGNVFLWHPEGRPIEIRVVAGKRAGGSLVSRWLAGLCLDEAPRMVGAAEGVINYDDAYDAAVARILPGGQIMSIGSPWAATGPIYNKHVKHFGRPSRDIVIIKATGPAMNPTWWTPDRCEKIRRLNPLVYKTDVLAEFADSEEQLYPMKVIKECTRLEPMSIPWDRHYDYIACIDPATRVNAWVLVIFSRRGNKFRMVYADEWRGSPLEPLRPRQVLAEIAQILRGDDGDDEDQGYHLDWCYTDEWSAEALQDLAEEFGISLVIEDWTQKEKTDTFTSLGVWMADGRVELAPHPHMEQDFKQVRRRATMKGFSVQLVQTQDGRHADFASAAARCLKQHLEEEIEDPPQEGTKEWWDQLENDILEHEVAKNSSSEWWAHGVVPEEELWR